MFKKAAFACLVVLGVASGLVLTPFVARAVSVEVTDVGNALCPVSGEPVNPKVSYVHEGKRYHFCCKGCVKKFKKNPEKYMAVLHGGHSGEEHSGHDGGEHAGHKHG